LEPIPRAVSYLWDETAIVARAALAEGSAASIRSASLSRSCAVSRRASQMAGLPARSENARYHPANSLNFRGSVTPKNCDIVCRILMTACTWVSPGRAPGLRIFRFVSSWADPLPQLAGFLNRRVHSPKLTCSRCSTSRFLPNLNPMSLPRTKRSQPSLSHYPCPFRWGRFLPSAQRRLRYCWTGSCRAPDWWRYPNIFPGSRSRTDLSRSERTPCP
jgi:hypothetical protein